MLLPVHGVVNAAAHCCWSSTSQGRAVVATLQARPICTACRDAAVSPTLTFQHTCMQRILCCSEQELATKGVEHLVYTQSHTHAHIRACTKHMQIILWCTYVLLCAGAGCERCGHTYTHMCALCGVVCRSWLRKVWTSLLCLGEGRSHTMVGERAYQASIHQCACMFTLHAHTHTWTHRVGRCLLSSHHIPSVQTSFTLRARARTHTDTRTHARARTRIHIWAPT